MRSLSPLAIAVIALTGCPMDVGPGYETSRREAAAGYSTLGISGKPTSVPASEQADMNIKLRGWRQTTGKLTLVSINGPTDALAPRLDSIFDGGRLPPMARVYRVGVFAGVARGLEPGGGNVHLVDFATTAGQAIHTPRSGRDIGGGFAAMVIYADSDSLALKYTREDSVVSGYTIHMIGLRVDTGLLSRYRGCVAAGRRELPALRGGDRLGTATGSLKVAVRDTGSFMDPRSRKDWYSAGVQPAPPSKPPSKQPPSIPASPPSSGSGSAKPATHCSAAGVSFVLDAAPAACATRRVRVTAPTAYQWVMGGGAAASGQPAWVGGATDVSCSGGTCSWTFASVRFPCAAGPYRVGLLADAVNDDPRRGRVIASCRL